VGFELRREIRDLLPRGGTLTDKECRLILELADNANDQTRRAWPGVEWLASVCDIPNPKRVGEFLTSIARKWVELRVELGKDRHGKPYFAKSGHRTVYRFPTRTELVEMLGEDQVPPTPGLDARKDTAERGPEVPAKEGAEVPPTPGAQVPALGGPFSSGSPQISSSKNSSSLSPHEDDQPTVANVPTQRTEREDEDASQNNQIDNPIHRLLLDAGCPSERLTEAERWITDECQPRGLGWWRKTAGNGDLKVHVAAFLEAGPTASCPDCDDTGETGDWMNRRPCSCIWWKDPTAARSKFIAQLKDFPNCEHGWPGGDLKAPNGWQHCSICRGRDWVDPNVQTAPDGFRAMFNRSPADRAVRDAQPLYDKYKRQEERNGAYLGPTGYHHLKDSRHPGRDYSEPL
jgi:hypothetical protein